MRCGVVVNSFELERVREGRGKRTGENQDAIRALGRTSGVDEAARLQEQREAGRAAVRELRLRGSVAVIGASQLGLTARSFFCFRPWRAGCLGDATAPAEEQVILGRIQAWQAFGGTNAVLVCHARETAVAPLLHFLRALAAFVEDFTRFDHNAAAVSCLTTPVHHERASSLDDPRVCRCLGV